MKAAMRKADITPKKDVFLEGYGGRDETALAIQAQNFSSDMIARVLIVSDGAKTSVYLNLEMVITGFGYNISVTLRTVIAEMCSTTIENVILSNTHNHQGMGVLDAAQELAIVDAVKDAYENLENVTVAANTYGTRFGVSRGPAYAVDEDGVYDNTMTVIRFDSEQTGAPVGMIYAYSVHNTALGVNCVPNWKLLNCELCGYTCRCIEEKYGNHFTAMFISGFYGNSGPYFPFKAPGTRHYAMTPEELKGYGAQLAEEVLTCYRGLVPVNSDGYTVCAISDMKTLQRAPLTEGTQKYWGSSDTFPLYLSIASFGDIVFLGVNYEPFSVLAARVRAESPYAYLIPAGNCGGWNGYIPTREVFNSGRFEHECQPWKTAFTEDTADDFCEKCIQAVCALKGVDLTRTEAQLTHKQEKNGVRSYEFIFEQEVSPNKLVVSFGQVSRLDSAAEFTLALFDSKEKLTDCIEVADNSTNFLGFFTAAKVKKAVLTVAKTYRSDVAKDAPAALWAVNFTER